MAKEDYYKLLDLDRGASEADIKKSYRSKAMKFHPDRNKDDPTAEEKFKEIKEAYEVLSDANKRARYDQYGHAGLESGGAQYADPFSAFSDLFGQQQQRGADILTSVTISLQEAALGTDKNITVAKTVDCRDCGGSGAKKGTSPVICPTCAGVGATRFQHGMFSMMQQCNGCGGTGRVIKDKCGTCHGTGSLKQNKQIKVTIPPGVDTGNRMRVPREGEQGPNGSQPGDLHVQINVTAHSIFKRDRADLRCEVPVDFATAWLGGEAEVPTFSGKINLKIPAGVQSGQQLKVPGRGVPVINSTAVGDLICVIKILTPTKLTDQQKELVASMRDSLSDNAYNTTLNTWSQKVAQVSQDIKNNS